MFILSALVSLAMMVLPPVAIHTTPTLAYPSIITRVKEDLESLGHLDIITEDDNDVEADSDEDTSPDPSTIFSVEDTSDTSSLSDESECEESFKPEDIQKVKVKSAVPRHVLLEWDGKEPEKGPASTRWITCKEVNAGVDYDARYLTGLARWEAEDKSYYIQRKAWEVAEKWYAKEPLEAHDHPAPCSYVRPSILKGLGYSSRLRESWTTADLEVESRGTAVEETNS